MRISDSEKRTIRLAAMVLVAFLGLFALSEAKAWMANQQGQYDDALRLAQDVEYQVLARTKEAKRFQVLRARYPIDPQAVTGPNLVTDVRVAMEAAARVAGVTLGPTRETPGAGRTVAVLQCQPVGETRKLLDFVRRIRASGFPLVVDRFGLNCEGETDQARLDIALSVRRVGKGL